MKVLDVRHIEDCFDGSYMYEVLFDAELQPAFIEALGTEGQLQYHRTFARPFFKAIFEGRFTIKGVQGNRTVRVLIYDKDLDPLLEYLRRTAATCEYVTSGEGCQTVGHDTEVT